MRQIYFVVVVLTVNFLYAFEPPEKFDRELVFNKEYGVFKLYWKVVGDEIIFEAHVATLGWIGLGFSDDGQMAGSDMVVGGVRNNHTYLYDCFAFGYDRPKCDEHQDYKILFGGENGTHTVLKFKRKLLTCDKLDWQIKDDTVHVLWAYDSEDAESSKSFKEHRSMGSEKVLLLQPSKSKKMTMPSDVVIYDLTVTNVSIPNDTEIFCIFKIFKMPPKPKHHIVKYEILTDPGSSLLEHVTVYHCLSNMEKFVGVEKPCITANQTRFSELYKCTSRQIARWATGAEAVVYPDKLGFPIFEKGRSPYLLMELDYYNRWKFEGLVDNSGIRFYITPKLRSVEIGSIVLSLSTIVLPQMQSTIKSAAVCSSKCTQMLPETGINIMSGFLLQHQEGRSITLRHVRNGAELPQIFEDHQYNYNFQQQRYLPLQNARKVLPNDTLIVECEWQTHSASNVTFYGHSPYEEMCLIVLQYYPKTDNLLTCASGPTQYTLAEGLGAKILSLKVNDGSNVVVKGLDGSNMTVQTYSTQIEWSMEEDRYDYPKLQSPKMEKLQQKLNTGPYYEYCSKRLDQNSTTKSKSSAGLTPLPKDTEFVEKLEEYYFPVVPWPKISAPYVAQNSCRPEITKG